MPRSICLVSVLAAAGIGRVRGRRRRASQPGRDLRFDADDRGHRRHQVDLVAQSARPDPARRDGRRRHAIRSGTRRRRRSPSCATAARSRAPIVVGDRVTIAGAPSRARPQRDPRAQHAAARPATSSRSAGRRRYFPEGKSGPHRRPRDDRRRRRGRDGEGRRHLPRLVHDHERPRRVPDVQGRLSADGRRAAPVSRSGIRATTRC